MSFEALIYRMRDSQVGLHGWHNVSFLYNTRKRNDMTERRKRQRELYYIIALEIRLISKWVPCPLIFYIFFVVW